MTLKVRTCQHGLSLHLKVIKWRMANIKKLSYHRLLEILTQLMASGIWHLQLLKSQIWLSVARETGNSLPIIVRQPPRGSVWVEKLSTWHLNATTMQVLESINIREREQETRLTVVSARPVSFSLSPPRSQVSRGVPGMRFHKRNKRSHTGSRYDPK